MDGNKEGNQHCDAESFSSRQLMCHDSWATAGIRWNLMEELSFCLNQEEIRSFFPSGVWTREQCCTHKGLSTKYLGEKDRNVFKPQLWKFGSCMDEAMCREAEWSPREAGQGTWGGSKGHGPTELFQAAEADPDMRSKETVLAWFSHA